MPAKRPSDDVIRIRIDTAQAVRDFLDLLASQAAEGETRAPANPANRAVYRELAPYRLVEYEYVDDAIGAIEGVFVGFPDGAIYSVADDIPEAAVDALVAAAPDHLAPIYVSVVLAEAQPAERIEHFLSALGCHVGQPVTGVWQGDDGRINAQAYECAPGCSCGGAQEGHGAVACSGVEAPMHLTKAQILQQFAERSVSPDGRAYASLSFDFALHLLEFPSATDRDDFVAWSRAVCEWVRDQGRSWEQLGFAEVLRPAQESPAGGHATPLVSPAKYGHGEAWHALHAGPVKNVGQLKDAGTGAERALLQARAYWDYVTRTVAEAERR